METKRYAKQYKANTFIPAPVEEVFMYVDDHANYYSHVITFARRAGGKMDIRFDDGNGQRTGSHIYLEGALFGKSLSLEEVIIRRMPPQAKTWETVGTPKFLIIGQYRYDIDIEQKDDGCLFKVSFSYNPPKGSWLRKLIGDIYAKTCAKEMVKVTRGHFEKRRRLD